MDKHDLVSVVMPVYNAEKYLSSSIESVIHQSYKNWELIVVDDCSQDASYAIIKQYCANDSRIRCISLSGNRGVAAARNAGVAESRGKYIAFIDSDDLWHPNKLHTQLQYTHTGAELIYCAYAIMDDTTHIRDVYHVPTSVDFRELLKENVIGCSTVMLPAKIAKQYPFQKRCFHEDYRLWLQLLQEGMRAVGCAEPLVYWRYHRRSRSSEKVRSAYNRWQVYNEFDLSFREKANCFAHYCIKGLRKYRSLFRRGVKK